MFFIVGLVFERLERWNSYRPGSVGGYTKDVEPPSHGTAPQGGKMDLLVAVIDGTPSQAPSI